MNQTPNYQLNQWESTDRVLMEDFNADNAKLDAALKAEADARAAKDAALQTAVNAKATTSSLTALASRVTALEADRVYVGSYTGNGTAGQVMPLPWQPKVAFIIGPIARVDYYMSVCFADKVLLPDAAMLSDYAPIIQGASLLVRHKDWYATGTTWIIAFR